MPATQLLMSLAVACMIYFALELARSGAMTAGDFVSFIATTTFLLAPMKQLAEISGPLERGLAAAEGVFALIDEHAEDDRGTIVLGRARGAIRFDDVTLRYVEEPVVRAEDAMVVEQSAEPRLRRAALRGIDLDIGAGETIALVGSSGGGKTSLANLIPRLLSRDGRSHPDRRHPDRGHLARQPAGADRDGQPGRGAVQRDHRSQHRVRRRRARC